jgi:hypothetical protein
MLHLQEKAHFSLDEFRRGKGSPLSRYGPTTVPTTPGDDNDELSILGGKTRLVSKKEPESPTVERSPTSHNPIVPLPLSPTMQSQVHPSVVEYLQSFNNSGHSQQLHQIQTSSNTNGFSHDIASGSANHDSYPDDISPVSIYGMSTSPEQSYQDTSSYLPQQMRGMMQSSQQNMTSRQQAPQMSTRNENTFPQYFPVYDYGASSSYTNGNSFGHGPAPILDANPAPGQRRSSGSPDVNMQSTWQEFVNGLAIP